MKQFNGYSDAKKQAQATGGAKLPAGAYVCKVLGVRYEEGMNGNSDRLVLQFDITEGEQKDFYKEQYEANTSEDKKWKGVVRIYVPNDDGSEKDGWTKKSFAGWIDAIEKSNSGYSWNWDEQTLKNKEVGIVFGETGTVIDGKNIVYTEPRFGIEVEKVRSGKAPMAKFKSKNGYGTLKAAPNDDDFMTIKDGVEEEVPF
jgi:hypothetical protein